MSDKKNGRLVVTVKKNLEWTKCVLPNGESLRFLIRDAKCGNPKLSKVVIDCPRNINIIREIDGNGNC